MSDMYDAASSPSAAMTQAAPPATESGRILVADWRYDGACLRKHHNTRGPTQASTRAALKSAEYFTTDTSWMPCMNKQHLSRTGLLCCGSTSATLHRQCPSCVKT